MTDIGPRTITRDEALAALATARELRAYGDGGAAPAPVAATVAKAAKVKGARLQHWGTSVTVYPRPRTSVTRYVILL